MNKAFPTQEIGSLPKFGWRTKPFRGTPLNEADLSSAARWGSRLGIKDSKALLEIISKTSGFSKADKRKIVEYSMLYALAMQEKAGSPGTKGLDQVWSGEQARTEMYETPVANINGFQFIGRVRSWDNKYWRIASVRGKPAYKNNYHSDEFNFVKSHTARRIKVPITDAITIMAWSDNFYYAKKWASTGQPPAARSFNARREFTLDVARVIRKVVRDLIGEGAEEFQLDIPAATQYQTVDDAKLVTEAFNETTKGLSARFSVHSCFPPRVGYALLFPYLLDMKRCSRFSFEYANRDSYKRGQSKETRTGYADLRLFKEYSYAKELGVGVIHVHTDRLPSEEVVKDRILFASKATGLGPERIYVNPDCGLRTRSPEIAYRMLGLVVAGARRARREIGD
jgi:5-methyltetrahydropteroyltriglutamate--homocysteine methyltransferase